MGLPPTADGRRGVVEAIHEAAVHHLVRPVSADVQIRAAKNPSSKLGSA